MFIVSNVYSFNRFNSVNDCHIHRTIGTTPIPHWIAWIHFLVMLASLFVWKRKAERGHFHRRCCHMKGGFSKASACGGSNTRRKEMITQQPQIHHQIILTTKTELHHCTLSINILAKKSFPIHHCLGVIFPKSEPQCTITMFYQHLQKHDSSKRENGVVNCRFWQESSAETWNKSHGFQMMCFLLSPGWNGLW